MSEIVIGDVLAWEPRLEWQGDEVELLRPMSWAVTIHATIPALPPLRGGELIVVPQRALDDLYRGEMVGWADIVRWLSAEPVAGLMVERQFDHPSIPGVALLRCDPGFLTEAEPYLNRTITEHRAELYRLGSDLSRALSTASIAGADLDALLAVAGDVGRHVLLLFDRSGTMLGRSRVAPTRLPFTAQQAGVRGDVPFLIHTGEGRWIVDRLRSPGGEPMYLATTYGTTGAPETDRLVLTQTARAIETFLGPLGDRRFGAEAPSRDSLLADLLLGRITDHQLEAQADVLGIEPGEPLRVALFVSNEPGFERRVRTGLSRPVRRYAVTLSPQELAVVIPEGGWNDWWDELQALARLEGSVCLIRSEQQPGSRQVALGARQARTLGRLCLAGLIDEPVIDADDLGRTGLFSVLLSVWDPAVFTPGTERMLAFADALIGCLEEHDHDRSSDLVRTLEGYLDAGGSTTGAAVRLGIHRNTLGYRLNRISQLTGSDLGDADVRLSLGLALKIRQLQRLIG